MSVYKVLREVGGQSLAIQAKRVLVAGFDAFDKLDANPSQTIVETLGTSIKLPGRKDEVLLDTLVLPTCCSKAWASLSADWMPINRIQRGDIDRCGGKAGEISLNDSP